MITWAIYPTRPTYTFRLSYTDYQPADPMPRTWLDATVTVYNPEVGQCDSTPLETACDVIDIDKLRSGRLRWCAVSRDILEAYHYGDTIDIYIAPNHKYNGKWVIKDTMNRRKRNAIDLLTYDDKLGLWDASYL